MIDVHVHLRDGVQKKKETIEHGLRVAASCGITALFDMPNTIPTLTSSKAINERIAYGQQIAKKVSSELNTPLFYGVYGGVTAELPQLKEMVDLYHQLHPTMVGLKMFAGHSTGNMGLIAQQIQQLVYAHLCELQYRGVLAVHCEKEQLMHSDLFDPAHPETHQLARPVEAEIASVADQIQAACTTGFVGKLHICHISTAGAIALVSQARNSGMAISCGATAHHALLSDAEAALPDNLGKMNPPLRGEADRKAVFEGLCSGAIDWIESDHAPHTLADKRSGASGVPGFAGTALLLQKLYREGLSKERLMQLCGQRANEVYGINWPVTVPSEALLARVLPSLRSAYPWDPFSALLSS